MEVLNYFVSPGTTTSRLEWFLTTFDPTTSHCGKWKISLVAKRSLMVGSPGQRCESWTRRQNGTLSLR
jgi:hypothetical protein